MWEVFTAGLILGMVSSFHCLGMCGPLAMALPIQRLSRPWQVLAVLSYHAGRILTYVTLGLICGLLGRRIYIAGFQQAWSIGLGVLLLGWVTDRWVIRGLYGINGRPLLLKKFYPRLQLWIAGIWASPSKSSFIFLGMANGLLPCGMVYLALAGALATSDVKNSIIFMAFFGAGTLPAMLGLHYFRRLIGFSFRNTVKRSMPFFIAAMAVLLILRGLNLGIPYISPALAGRPGQAISCH